MKKETLTLMKCGVIAVAMALLDQLSKYWVLQGLAVGESAPFIGSLVCLTHIHNRGCAFGLFKDAPALFVLMGFLIPSAIILLFRRIAAKGTAWVIAVSLILGGAAGNLIDRLTLGYVVDFVDIRIRGNNVWPIFNVADISISLGVAVILFLILGEGNKSEENTADNHAKE